MKKTESDDVEELLRAAEEDVLLKMSLNSHMARGSSSRPIDPDLDRRFLALKFKPSSSPIKTQKPNPSSSNPESANAPSNSGNGAVVVGYGDDDLFARFAALKSSHPTNDSSKIEVKKWIDHESEESEDEVEKIVQWAIDAARLDPSPSDSDDDGEDDDDGVRNGKRNK